MIVGMSVAVNPWRVSLGLEPAVENLLCSGRDVAIGTGSLCHELRICFSWLSAVILVDFDRLDPWAKQARAYIPIFQTNAHHIPVTNSVGGLH